MPAARFDFADQHRVEQGVDSTRQFIWKESDGTPRNLTGWTAAMQVRPSAKSDTVLLDLKTTNGGMSLGGTSGTINVHFKASDTTGVTWSSGVYDIELTDPAGKKMRFIEGDLVLSAEVTRE